MNAKLPFYSSSDDDLMEVRWRVQEAFKDYARNNASIWRHRLRKSDVETLLRVTQSNLPQTMWFEDAYRDASECALDFEPWLAYRAELSETLKKGNPP